MVFGIVLLVIFLNVGIIFVKSIWIFVSMIYIFVVKVIVWISEYIIKFWFLFNFVLINVGFVKSVIIINKMVMVSEIEMDVFWRNFKDWGILIFFVVFLWFFICLLINFVIK